MGLKFCTPPPAARGDDLVLMKRLIEDILLYAGFTGQQYIFLFLSAKRVIIKALHTLVMQDKITAIPSDWEIAVIVVVVMLASNTVGLL